MSAYTFQKAVHPLIGCWSNRKSPLELRFWSKVQPQDSGCWEWTGATSSGGYGQIGNDGKVLFAHRVAYEMSRGPIPDGLHIDHLCNNRRCVRAMHLEAVTQGENNQRMWDRRPERTECRNGHALAEYGLTADGSCRRCSVEANRRWRASRNGR